MNHSFYIVIIAALIVGHELRSTDNPSPGKHNPFFATIDDEIFYVENNATSKIIDDLSENNIKTLNFNEYEKKFESSFLSRLIFGDVVVAEHFDGEEKYYKKSIAKILGLKTFTKLKNSNILIKDKKETQTDSNSNIMIIGNIRLTQQLNGPQQESSNKYKPSNDLVICKRNYTKPACLAGLLAASLLYFFLKDKNIVITN